jgi:hypothetical protein
VRSHRVRFTKPAIREAQPRAVKTRDGISAYRHNDAGRHAKREAIGEQRRRQQSLCADCGGWLELADTKFRDKQFREGIENQVIHKSKCNANA